MPAFFTPWLKRAGYLDQLWVRIGHVGSRPISEADDWGQQGWDVFAPNLEIYGFDADPDACEAANTAVAEKGIPWPEIHVPLVLSDRCDTQTLYITQDPMCSSLYPPNEPFLTRFQVEMEMMKGVATVEVETTTLDVFCQEQNLPGFDYLRTDVQGADLDVLRGAARILAEHLLVVEMEVIFSPLYLGQPLFADVDTFLRQQGFTLFQLSLHVGATRRLFPVVNNPMVYRGQKLWGDAVYVRDVLDPATSEPWRSPERIFKLACLMDVRGYWDYAAELLVHLIENHRWPLQDLLLQAIQEQIPAEAQAQIPLVEYLHKALAHT
ncbi:MAG: FkbM family methyltransferase [Gloeomargarita sp. HHBFW_bins_205]